MNIEEVQRFISEGHETIANLGVTLDSDPLSYGPKRINEKIAECRRQIDKVVNLILSVSSTLRGVKGAARISREEYELKFRELLTSDPVVRSGSSLVDRKATADLRIGEFRHRAEALESLSSDLEDLLTAVKIRKDDLRNTQQQLKEQVNVCREEISLGGRWGSKSFVPSTPSSMPSKFGTGTSDQNPDVEDVERLMDESLRDLSGGGNPLTPNVGLPQPSERSNFLAPMAVGNTPDLENLLSEIL